MSLKGRKCTSNRHGSRLDRYQVDTYKQQIPTNLSLNLNEVSVPYINPLFAHFFKWNNPPSIFISFRDIKIAT